jgi:hypothetical protein
MSETVRRGRRRFFVREFHISADTEFNACAILSKYLGDISCILRYKSACA